MPDGNKLTSTHTCNLGIPWLPVKVTEAHIIPGLSHSSLIAASKFYDNGYTLVYNADSCTVTNKHDQVALIGQCDRATGLWHLPVNPPSPLFNQRPRQHLPYTRQ